MGKIITIPFTESFIDRLADYIHDEYILKGQDLRRLGIVFGGRRPSLFLKRALARRTKQAFYPPQTMTIDDFVGRVTSSQGRKPLLDLDHCFVIYTLAQEHAPQILEGREEFVQFLPWAREVLHFIEQLDLEDSPPDALNILRAHAAVGFNVPVEINRLLESLMVLRAEYHRYLDHHNLSSRGYQYLRASRLVDGYACDEFDKILFCNFFYLHKTEMKTIKGLFDRNKADLIMQGDQRRWPALKRIADNFGISVVEGPSVVPTKFDLKVYAAFDMHAQAGLVGEILKGIPDPSNAVIVLPNADFMLPLLSAIGPTLSDFNISLGYPLRRSSIYALLESVIQAHKTMKGELYYSRDYLRVLHHPLVKSLELDLPLSTARTLIHKLEEVLTGAVISELSGQTFVSIEDILHDEALFDEAALSLKALDVEVSTLELKTLMKQLHRLLFSQWQGLSTFIELSSVLDGFCATMSEKSGMTQYPFNERVASRLRDIASEWAAAEFSQQRFLTQDLFSIVAERLSRELVAFNGSPLKGLQILGLLETRSLSFEHVIVVDVNERILPNLNIYEPLIPREVMIKMNIDRLELEEEIQRYQFMRLISSARHVHLIYQERSDKERSRFVEELVWEQELKDHKRGAVEIIRPAFNVAPSESIISVPKSEAIVEFLKTFTFSASSVNTYLRNPYEFYQSYVLGLREKEDLLEEPESRHVGTFIHGLLEDAFRPFIGKKPVMDAVFEKNFVKLFDSRFEKVFGRGMKSDAFLMKAVLENRLKHFLDVESKRIADVAEILFIERKFEDVIDLPCGKVRFNYRVDRVERLNDSTILILDYKTGGMDAMPTGFDPAQAFSREMLRDKLISFQMPLYLHYLNRQYPSQPVNAALYHLRTMEMDRFITAKNPMSKEEMISGHLHALDFVMSEIFNPNIPFTNDPVDIK